MICEAVRAGFLVVTLISVPSIAFADENPENSGWSDFKNAVRSFFKTDEDRLQDEADKQRNSAAERDAYKARRKAERDADLKTRSGDRTDFEQEQFEARERYEAERHKAQIEYEQERRETDRKFEARQRESRLQYERERREARRRHEQGEAATQSPENSD